MGKVYSFSGFANALLKNNIMFSIRDFLDEKKVDLLIKKLVEKTCSEKTFAGAGISRSCFIDSKGDCAIKVDKYFYVDYEDEIAEEEYYDNCSWNDDDYEEGGYAFDNLYMVTKDKFFLRNFMRQSQNTVEVELYDAYLRNKNADLDYMAKIYAIASDNSVEIMELCSKNFFNKKSKDYALRLNYIEENFSDIHYGNLGINKFNKLVVLDYGFD